MLETLDAAAVRRWCDGGLEALRAHQREIDDLNVYPVPDGDTGTNLVLTLTAAREALTAPVAALTSRPGALTALPEALSTRVDGQTARPEALTARSEALTALPEALTARSEALTALPEALSTPVEGLRTPAEGSGTPAAAGDPGETQGVGGIMRRMARGALLGARGNSGVIVSQILRGMADAFAGTVAVRGGELARALRTATDAAYAAVARPVEGTVLSVVAAAAEGAGRIKSDNLVTVARAAARAATEALARTPQQLPVLAQAGVVDAGGRGLCLLLDALVDALDDDAAPSDPSSDSRSAALSLDSESAAPSAMGESAGPYLPEAAATRSRAAADPDQPTESDQQADHSSRFRDGNRQGVGGGGWSGG
ncbi:DAK2 domain-containing protein, partial [Actinoplanes italicus]